MISIYKNDNKDIVMVFTDSSRIQLKGTLANVLEELQIVANGDSVTSVDADRCNVAIADLKELFGELLEKEPSFGERMAEKYAQPATYYGGSPEYNEIDSIIDYEWDKFLRELGKQGLSCNYNPTFDCFTIN